ncbi:MAG: carcinine hydrolase/isopenicillin-N N-acyltransferase family protein [Anaerolineales bacterium]|nr:carcinine hydrolase/isopenicillin-N N-acyltransferase family protein [Anaerolineales bacterium]
MIDTRKILGAIIAFVWTIAGCAAPVATPMPRADGLSAQVATLDSLQKVDDHPLYTMRYVGAYSAQTLPTEPSFASRASPLAWGCSLFAALGDPGAMLYGRNFDWDHSPAILLFTEPPDSYASVSMVDIAYLGFTGNRANSITDLSLAERRALLRAPSLPFDGMNARGLVVGMAAVPPGNMSRDPTKPTMDSLRVIREMLDRAATVDEAIALMQRYNIDFSGGPPIHYLVADASGRAALIEFYQGKMIVIPNETAWHQATNFIRSSVENAQGQCWRYDSLARQLTSANGRATADSAMKFLRDVAQNSTQWSVVYGMSTGEIRVTMGRQYDRAHTFKLKMENR